MTSTLNIGGVAILNKGFCANKKHPMPPYPPPSTNPQFSFFCNISWGPLPPRPPLDHWPVLHFCDHWQMTVKVVGGELAGSRGGSEIGGVITGNFTIVPKFTIVLSDFGGGGAVRGGWEMFYMFKFGGLSLFNL